MKKTKRIISLICLIFIIIMTFEKSISIAAIAHTSNDLSTLEEDKLKEMVSRKLNLTEFNYEVISGFHSSDRYVLVEGKNCYLIYDRELSDYIEFSTVTNSIYYNMDSSKKKVYLGPTYYFSEENGNMTDLYSATKVSIEAIEEYKSVEEELKKNYIQNKQEHTQSLEKEAIVMSAKPSDPVYIPYSHYYEALRDNLGTNANNSFAGSCSYVAAEMILSYYDSTENDIIIDEKYDVNKIKYFSSGTAINSIDDFGSSPGVDDRFHTMMIELGRSLGYTASNAFNIGNNDLKKLLKIYLDDKQLKYTFHSADSSKDKKNFCMEAINSGNPVGIFIKGDKTMLVQDHAIVGYGYDDTGIYAHFGWNEMQYCKMNINQYTIYDAYYIELNDEHSCTNNYLWGRDGCKGTFCPCGKKTCDHRYRSFAKFNSGYHQNICDGCGSYTLEKHNFNESNGWNICKDCGFKIELNHTHSYTYTPRADGKHHTSTCLCGDTKIEDCFGYSEMGGTVYCAKCGQKISGGIKFPFLTLNSIKSLIE